RRQEAPLHAGREARTAAAAQAAVLGRLDEVGGRLLQGPAQRLVALVVLVCRQRPALRVVPELREDGRQPGAHLSASFVPSSAAPTLPSPGFSSGSLAGVSVEV